MYFPAAYLLFPLLLPFPPPPPFFPFFCAGDGEREGEVSFVSISGPAEAASALGDVRMTHQKYEISTSRQRTQKSNPELPYYGFVVDPYNKTARDEVTCNKYWIGNILSTHQRSRSIGPLVSLGGLFFLFFRVDFFFAPTDGAGALTESSVTLDSAPSSDKVDLGRTGAADFNDDAFGRSEMMAETGGSLEA